VVECHLAKVDVEGSSPFSRSTNRPERELFLSLSAAPTPLMCLFREQVPKKLPT
jgi:hypothetical protein